MSERSPIASPAGNEVPKKFDARLAEGVAYFEQMLEIMPEDRTTLEFLVVAYDMLGEHEKGQKALVSLAKILLKENDLEALKGLLPRLRESDYPPAKVLHLKVSTLTAPAPDLTPERPKELTESEKTALAAQEAISAEKALLALLKEAGIIQGSDLDAFASHLILPSVEGRVFLISALQILKNENPSLYEKSVEYLADHFNTPPIPLSAFEPTASYFKAYSKRIMRLRGVVPFAKIGNVMLVAMLNPADAALKAEIESAGPCRLYLANPADVEAALEKVFGASSEGGSA